MPAFHSGLMNRERLHFGCFLGGLQQPLVLPEELAGHWCQPRVSLGVVATFGSPGRAGPGAQRGCAGMLLVPEDSTWVHLF